MKIYKIHLVAYLIVLGFIFLMALSTQFKWALNVFNFGTIVLFLLGLIFAFMPEEMKDDTEKKKPKLPKEGYVFLRSARISIVIICAALGMFWQAVLWLLITMFIYAEAQRAKRKEQQG